ncbi:hypothetical protein [Anoxynatronum sibiricum]|uniref:Uncharacterized protein n=1 Tax=Anoxynatronum sibiricum TaxID=210623 RepID=A0ABU9VXB1_9CLOT
MPDTTYSVRVPEELKEKMTQVMQESGLTGKEFVSDLLSLYQLHLAKENVPVALQSDIDELRRYTNRINHIYANIVERTYETTQLQKATHEEAMEKVKAELLELQEDFQGQKESLALMKEEKAALLVQKQNLEKERDNKEKEYQRSLSIMADNLKGKETLLMELKEKAENLAGIVSDQKTDIEQAKAFEKEAQEAQKALEKETREKEELAAQLAATKKELKAKETAHGEALATLEEKLTLACDQKLLKMQQDHQGQLQEIQEGYNAKVKELLLELEKGREK